MAQSRENTLSHDKRVFHALWKRLEQIETWRELAIRPELDDSDPEDRDLFQNEFDDVKELSQRCLQIRNQMNSHIVPQLGDYEEFLVPRPSQIAGAGLGLFWLGETVIPAETTICYYYGNLHTYESSKTLKERTDYLMMLQGELFVDPGPLPEVKARYINDPINEHYNCKFIPRRFYAEIVSIKPINPKEELFMSYGEAFWANKQRGSAGVFAGGEPEK